MGKLVVAVEGAHGVGKSCMLRGIKDWYVLPELFVDAPEVLLPGDHPQSFVNEMRWLCDWARRVERALLEHDVVFTDRSLLSAIVFARSGGEVLRAACDLVMCDWKRRGIELRILHVTCELDEHTRRLRARHRELASQPKPDPGTGSESDGTVTAGWRDREVDGAHVQAVRRAYKDMADRFDVTIDITTMDVEASTLALRQCAARFVNEQGTDTRDTLTLNLE